MTLAVVRTGCSWSVERMRQRFLLRHLGEPDLLRRHLQTFDSGGRDGL
jgi:hypothetical protein